MGRYIPWSEEKGDITACGIPQTYDASKEWADKKVVLFAVPGVSMEIPSAIPAVFICFQPLCSGTSKSTSYVCSATQH